MALLAREASERRGRGFGQFRRLANGSLERFKKMGMLWPDWLLVPKGVAFCELWRCAGWETAPLNALTSRILWLHWLVKLPTRLAQVFKKMIMPWPEWLLVPKRWAFCELWHSEGLQTAPLNALKSSMLWLHWLVKLPRGVAEVLGSFDGWQTALLNALKR